MVKLSVQMSTRRHRKKIMMTLSPTAIAIADALGKLNTGGNRSVAVEDLLIREFKDNGLLTQEMIVEIMRRRVDDEGK